MINANDDGEIPELNEASSSLSLEEAVCRNLSPQGFTNQELKMLLSGQCFEYKYFEEDCILLEIFQPNSSQLSIVMITYTQTDNKHIFKLPFIFSKSRDSFPHQPLLTIEKIKIVLDQQQRIELAIKTPSKQLKKYKQELFFKGQKWAKLKRLDEDQQSAIIAIRIIAFIIRIEEDKFYQDQEKKPIGMRILNELDILQKRNIFKEQVIERFKNYFNLRGIQYSDIIFSQKGFQDAETFRQKTIKRVTFFPTFCTSEIFKIILLNQLPKKHQIIFGTAGVGKSWTFILIHELMKPVEALLNLPFKNHIKTIHNFIDIGIALRLPKVFYFNISEGSTVQGFMNTISNQIFIDMPENQRHRIKGLLDRKELNKFIEETIQLYFWRMRPVFMVDQINLYLSMKRRQKVKPYYQPVNMAIKLILKSLDQFEQRGAIYYSSSLNKQRLHDQDPTVNQKQRFRYHKEHHLNWTKNCLNKQRFYETLRFLQFEMTRQIFHQLRGKRQTSFHDFNGIIQSIKRVFKQSLNQEGFFQLHSQSFMPLTLLQLRQYLDKNWNIYSSILDHEGNAQYDKRFDDCLKQFLKKMKKNSIQNTVTGFQQFLDKIQCQDRPNKVDALWCIFRQILKPILGKNLELKQMVDISIQQKITITSQRLIKRQQIVNMQKINQQKALLLSSIDNDLFRWDHQSSSIITYLPRRDMIHMAITMMPYLQETSSTTNYQQLYLLQEIASQNQVMIGSILDAIFSKFISSCQFLMDFGQQSQTIYVSNRSNSQRHFLHFLGYKFNKQICYPVQDTAKFLTISLGFLFVAINQQVSQKERKLKQIIQRCKPINRSQKDRILASVFQQIIQTAIRIANQQQKKQQSSGQNKQKLPLCKIFQEYYPYLIFLDAQNISKEQAQKWVSQFFKDLISESKKEFQTNNQAWVGASPVTKTGKKSFISPSIDSILIKYQQIQEEYQDKDEKNEQFELKIRNVPLYRVRTIDFSVQDMCHMKICERIQKSKNFINIITAYFKAAGLNLQIDHMIIASKKVKQRFTQIIKKEMPKKCTYTHELCFDHNQYKVVSFEQMRYTPIKKTMRTSLFDLVLTFTKVAIRKRDK